MIERSLRGDLKWRTSGHLLRWAADRWPDRTAIVDVDRTLTFADVGAEVDGFARALLSLDIRRGDRVAVWAPNCWQFEVAVLGANSVGAALVPINTRYRGSEAAYLIERSSPRLLVVTSPFLGSDYQTMLDEAMPPSAHRGLHRVLIDNTADDRSEGWDSFADRGKEITNDQLESRLEELSGEDLADVMFTSGTTGHPKGVKATHAQNLHAYYDWTSLAGFQSGERYALINPYFHAFGYKCGWLAALMHGITIYPHRTFDVLKLLQQVSDEKITLLPGPPTLYTSLLQALGNGADYDLSSLRLAITGAAAIPPTLISRMYEELGFEQVTTAYGLTESTGIATITRVGDGLNTVARTSGRRLPDVELKVDRSRSLQADADEAGEICIGGYNVMTGYFDDPGATTGAIDDDGWLHTGDVGIIDGAGNLRITDRLSDMLLVGGFNTYPAEIEALMSAHPAVLQVAVIGVPDKRLGEVPLAFVVPREKDLIDGGSLIAWCREHMANFKVPRHVEFVEALPQNATGKVLKSVLRDSPQARLLVDSSA